MLLLEEQQVRRRSLPASNVIVGIYIYSCRAKTQLLDAVIRRTTQQGVLDNSVSKGGIRNFGEMSDPDLDNSIPLKNALGKLVFANIHNTQYILLSTPQRLIHRDQDERA